MNGAGTTAMDRPKQRRTGLVVVMAALAVLGMFVGATAPAAAHGEVVCVYQGVDSACHSGPFFDKGIEVCDNEPDGNWVLVEYETSTGHYYLYDRGGWHTGCTYDSNVSGKLQSFKVCEVVDFDAGWRWCSDWSRHS